jgi:hypothetical protein
MKPNKTEDVNSQESSGWQELDLDNVNAADVDYVIEDEPKEEPKKPSEPKVEKKEPEFVLEEPQEEIQVEVEGEEASTETEQEDEPKQDTSSRAQKRIRQLIDREKAKDLELMELRRRLAEKEQLAQQHREAEASVRMNSVKAAIDTYKKELTRAVTENDVVSQVELQDKLSKANVELMALESLPKNTVRQEEYTQKQEQRQQQQQQHAFTRDTFIDALPDAGKKWARDNKWFLVNDVLTQAALSVSKEVESDGYSVEEPEYYQEVQKRMAELYPGRFAPKAEKAQEEPRKTVPQAVKAKPIVSGGKTAPTSKAGAIRLTKEDVAYAKLWNIPLKQYAEEKRKIELAEKSGSVTTQIFGE